MDNNLTNGIFGDIAIRHFIYEDKVYIHPSYVQVLCELTYLNKQELESIYKEYGYHFDKKNRTYQLLDTISGHNSNMLLSIHSVNVAYQKSVIDFKTGDTIEITLSENEACRLSGEKIEGKTITGTFLRLIPCLYYDSTKIPLLEIWDENKTHWIKLNPNIKLTK